MLTEEEIQCSEDAQLIEQDFNIDMIMDKELMEDEQPTLETKFVNEAQLISRLKEMEDLIGKNNGANSQ